MTWVEGMDGKGWDGMREWMERNGLLLVKLSSSLSSLLP